MYLVDSILQLFQPKGIPTMLNSSLHPNLEVLMSDMWILSYYFNSEYNHSINHILM
jgi:hypothetical protein